jgi:hypothetical protein
MNLKTLAIAWTLMWGLTYIIVAFIAPNIALDTPALFYVFLGAFILATLVTRYFAYNKLSRSVVRCLFFGLGVFEVIGGVMSWTGVGLWNVPFADVALFQISMAFADLISAVFLFVLAISKWDS